MYRANASNFLEFHIALLIWGYLNKLWDGESKGLKAHNNPAQRIALG